MTLEGPPEKTREAKEIVSKKGFSCGNILGELAFACAMCRLNIGHSVCLLAHSSDRLHKDHFDTLKGTCKSLQCTKHLGVLFCCLLPLDALSAIPFLSLEEDPDLLSPSSSKMS